MEENVGAPNVFVGCGETWPGARENIYGGQVAAQALLTVAKQGGKVPGIPTFGPTIDHAVWFHGRNNTPLKVGGHRGLYMASAHDEQGTLVAVMTQEMLLRDGVAPPNASASQYAG